MTAATSAAGPAPWTRAGRAAPPEAGVETRIVTTPDIQVSYALYGDPAGRPVLSLHGAPASRFMFDVADAAAQARGLCLICPDRPGYGLTPLQQQGLNVETLADRTAFHIAFADAVGLDRFAVLGISGGGPYATALAAREPTRVTALRLVSPLGPVADYDAQHRSGPAALKHAQRLFFLRLAEKPSLLHAVASSAARLFKQAPRVFAAGFRRTLTHPDRTVLAKPVAARSLIRMTEEALRQGSAGAEADLKVYARPWELAYNRIEAPTRVWQGSKDRIVPAKVACYLSELIPGAALVQLTDAGHFWVYDHADEILDTLTGAPATSVPRSD